MAAVSDDRIREKAYEIWQREGRPHGRAADHWAQAKAELMAAGKPAGKRATKGNGSTAKTPKPRTPKTKTT